LRVDGQLLSRYRFRHTLFQKYLYGSLDEVELVYLHEQVGKALEDLYQSQEETPVSADLAPKLAWHFREARIPDKATTYLLMAGERALLMSAYQEAVDHFTNGLDSLRLLPGSPDRDHQEVSLLLNLAMAWQGLEGARYPVVKQAYTRAYELCRQTGQTTQLSQLLGEMLEFAYVGADYEEARLLGEEALALAEQAADPVFEAFGHWYKGFVNFALGNFSASHDSLERVISFYEPRSHHQDFIVLRGKDAGLGALAYDACCLWCLGYPDQALERSQESLSLARELAQPFSQVDVLSFAGCVFNEMRRDASALKENAVEMVRLTSKMVPGWRGAGEMYLGEALVMSGQVQEGMDQIRDGFRTRRTINTLCYETGPLGTLARAEGMTSPSEGLKTITRALNVVERTGERYYEPELYRLQGDLYAMIGDDNHAEASYENAVEAAQHQNAKSWELRAAISLARLWHEQGRVDEALQMLKGVYDWFSEGFDTPDLLEAKEVLEDLSEERS
jgi:predicted ATPase